MIACLRSGTREGVVPNHTVKYGAAQVEVNTSRLRLDRDDAYSCRVTPFPLRKTPQRIAEKVGRGRLDLNANSLSRGAPPTSA